jgi:hypothetical protein
VVELAFLHNVLNYQQQPNWGVADNICAKYLESESSALHADYEIVVIIRTRIDAEFTQ